MNKRFMNGQIRRRPSWHAWWNGDWDIKFLNDKFDMRMYVLERVQREGRCVRRTTPFLRHLHTQRSPEQVIHISERINMKIG
jgi:hypothetical protein